MQIVIDIPERKYYAIKYYAIKSNLYDTFPAEMKEWGLEAIKNGTPLPKGHGRLIDADKLKQKWLFGRPEKVEIDIAPTIIEADKSESEDKA